MKYATNLVYESALSDFTGCITNGSHSIITASFYTLPFNPVTILVSLAADTRSDSSTSTHTSSPPVVTWRVLINGGP